MRNIEKAIAAYKARHDSRRDMTADEMRFFFDRIKGYNGVMDSLYDMFCFAFTVGYRAAKEDQRKGRCGA